MDSIVIHNRHHDSAIKKKNIGNKDKTDTMIINDKKIFNKNIQTGGAHKNAYLSIKAAYIVLPIIF